MFGGTFRNQGVNFMEAVYAPWRGEYIRSEKPSGCIFCKNSLRSDDYILWEGKSVYVMLNRYPYTCGHLMVIPFRHLGRLEEFTPEEKLETFDLVELAQRVLQAAMKPDGFNVGMNLGRVAGAGVDDHLHVHLVPRWNGDTNFMTVTGETRVISEDLSQTRASLMPLFSHFISPGGPK